MKHVHSLSKLPWKLTGWLPHAWQFGRHVEVGTSTSAEIAPVDAAVPGSVQMILLRAGLIEDWNVGLKFRDCQWVENYHWIYEAIIPNEYLTTGLKYRLRCHGLDGSGWVRLNGEPIGRFESSHVPHVFSLEPIDAGGRNVLQVIFECPPRWLGQLGYTSRMLDWKVRFNYSWDWTARLVQLGIWDTIDLEATDGNEIEEFICTGDVDPDPLVIAGGRVRGGEDCRVHLALERGSEVIHSEDLPVSLFNTAGVRWTGLQVERWWPNMLGEQPLYSLRCTLLDKNGIAHDEVARPIGFRSVKWRQCRNAPEGADPWICEVNGTPVFLQGVNWTPIHPNFADVTEDEYRKRLILYRDLGMNILRVWGGGVLEKECFYNLCDELGIMVWQEFPLSSSGLDDYPPEDERFIRQMESVAVSYIRRRRHHPSLIIWCGGNELITRDGSYVPVGKWHPMIRKLHQVCEAKDPGRRFLDTSPSGPKVHGHPENFGKGVNWDVHGPWNPDSGLDAWADYWSRDDALIRSELGSPGASSAEIIRRFAGDLDPLPATAQNPLWRRPCCWWVDYDKMVAELGREPSDLEEYVRWSQDRQARALGIAIKACKDRFPECGGVIVWMGHDCYPCAINTAIVDYDGNPKPAALEVAKIFRMGES